MIPAGIVKPEDQERWQNASYGLIIVKKYNSQGQLVEEKVAGKRPLLITPTERRHNQELAADSSLDPFSNGMLTPVRLIDSEHDTGELQANTNAMSETAMKALFKSQKPTFTKKVGEITNTITVRRLREVAVEVDATNSQIQVIDARLEELSPVFQEAAAPTYESARGGRDRDGISRGVTPR